MTLLETQCKAKYGTLVILFVCVRRVEWRLEALIKMATRLDYPVNDAYDARVKFSIIFAAAFFAVSLVSTSILCLCCGKKKKHGDSIRNHVDEKIRPPSSSPVQDPTPTPEESSVITAHSWSSKLEPPAMPPPSQGNQSPSESASMRMKQADSFRLSSFRVSAKYSWSFRNFVNFRNTNPNGSEQTLGDGCAEFGDDGQLFHESAQERTVDAPGSPSMTARDSSIIRNVDSPPSTIGADKQ